MNLSISPAQMDSRTMNMLALTFGDLLTKLLQKNGLGAGTANLSLIFMAMPGTCIVNATWQHYLGLKQSTCMD